MADILAHKREHPRHASNCEHIRAYVFEMRGQITSVIGSPHPYDTMLKAATARSLGFVLDAVCQGL